MNETQQVEHASALFQAIQGFFTANPIAKWLFLAWIFGWVVSFIARPFIRMSPLPDKVESHMVILTCIAASAGAAFRMWEGEYGLIVATVMGGTSPFGYLGLAKLLAWKFPSIRRHLSLEKDFAAAVDDETGDESRVPTKEDSQ